MGMTHDYEQQSLIGDNLHLGTSELLLLVRKLLLVKEIAFFFKFLHFLFRYLDFSTREQSIIFTSHNAATTDLLRI